MKKKLSLFTCLIGGTATGLIIGIELNLIAGFATFICSSIIIFLLSDAFQSDDNYDKIRGAIIGGIIPCILISIVIGIPHGIIMGFVAGIIVFTIGYYFQDIPLKQLIQQNQAHERDFPDKEPNGNISYKPRSFFNKNTKIITGILFISLFFFFLNPSLEDFKDFAPSTLRLTYYNEAFKNCISFSKEKNFLVFSVFTIKCNCRKDNYNNIIEGKYIGLIKNFYTITPFNWELCFKVNKND